MNSNPAEHQEQPASPTLTDHPLATIFPLMSEADLSTLADDIKCNGQAAPITILDSRILDGRNRYRACLLAGVEPITREFRGGDALQFVLSANLHRRHLSESQRAMVAAKIANLPSGRPGKEREPIGSLSKEQAAVSLNVGARSVQRAKAVLQDPALARAVEAGEKTVAAAEREMKARAGATTSSEVVLDATGYAIPDHLVPLWNRAEEVREIQRIIGLAKRLVNAAHAIETDRLWAGVAMPGIADQLRRAQRDLNEAIPYAVCVTCRGHSRDQCRHCKGKGFLSKTLFDRTVSGELKAIRAQSCVVTE